MNFCVYSDNGMIIQTGSCDWDSTLAHIPGNKLKGIDDAVNNGTHYIFDGRAVLFPEKPSEFHSWNWETKTWQADAELAETSARAKRDTLLAASDWTQLPDVPIETKTAWATYRQALRDLTDQTGFPFSIIWPTAPQQ